MQIICLLLELYTKQNDINGLGYRQWLPISSSYKPQPGHKCTQLSCKSDQVSHVKRQITDCLLLRYFVTTFKQNDTAAGAELVSLQTHDYHNHFNEQSCFQSSRYIQSSQQNRLFIPLRYLEASRDQLEEEEEEEKLQQKLEPTALSCYLNTAACNLKLQLWQDALDSCNQASLQNLWKSFMNGTLVVYSTCTVGLVLSFIVRNLLKKTLIFNCVAAPTLISSGINVVLWEE